MLASDLSPSLKHEPQAEMPGTTARRYLPAVTAVAIEVEKGLLMSDQSSSEVDRLLKTLIPAMRARIERDTGVRVPGVRVRENETDMPKNTYLIMINEVPIVMGTLDRSKLFMPDKDIAPRLERLPDYRYQRLGSYLSDGLWFDAALASEFYATEKRRIWDYLDYLANHLEHTLRQRLSVFLGVQEVDHLLHEWAGKYPEDADYLEGIRRDSGALARTTRRLRALVEERVSIGDPPQLLKGLRAVSELDESTQSIEVLRLALSERLAGNDLNHTHFRLSDEIEGMLDCSIADGGGKLAIRPEDLGEFLSALRTELYARSKKTALVVSIPRLRPFVRYMISSEWPDVPVLARDELLPGIDYGSLPTVSL
jgi:type III secretion protein V